MHTAPGWVFIHKLDVFYSSIVERLAACETALQLESCVRAQQRLPLFAQKNPHEACVFLVRFRVAVWMMVNSEVKDRVLSQPIESQPPVTLWDNVVSRFQRFVKDALTGI